MRNAQTRTTATHLPERQPWRQPWHRSTLAVTMLGGLLLWAAFPPLGWWLLAWLAPIPWVRLVTTSRLSGRRPYAAIFLGSFVHWLMIVQWVRLPHWSAYFGWPVLAGYLAIYLPIFVAISRVAVHRLHIPAVLAVPIVWTGIELARGHVATGFSLALLAHTQLDWLALVQIADLGGAYAVSFVMILVATSVLQAWRANNADLTASSNTATRKPESAEAAVGTANQDTRGSRSPVVAWKPLVPAAVVVALTLGYGYVRLAQTPDADLTRPLARVALVQGSIDTVFGEMDQTDEHFVHYLKPTLRLGEDRDDIDLVIWPESALAHTLFEFDSPQHIRFPSGTPGTEDIDAVRQNVVARERLFHIRAQQAVTRMDNTPGTPLLAGTGALEFAPDGLRQYNAALLIDSTGKIAQRYDKMHPVMFGEYVPLGRVFPWLYRLTPMPGGLTPGKRPIAIRTGAAIFAANICFENVVPHLIRRQVLALRAEAVEPDALVTLTNDGWFWGSSLLDLHLMCGRFRAIECRKPVVIAANTGISAMIDGSGCVLQRGPRRQEAVLVCDIRADERKSHYLNWGDLPAGGCLIGCVGIAGYGLLARLVSGSNAC